MDPVHTGGGGGGDGPRVPLSKNYTLVVSWPGSILLYS